MAALDRASIYGAFVANAARYSGKNALVYLGDRWSYGQLHQMCERFATALMGLGVTAGDRVLLYLPNIPQAIVVWLAVQRLGAIPVAISSIYTSTEFKYMTNDSGAKLVVCMDTNFNYVTRVLPETQVRQVIVCRTAEMLSPWRKAVLKAFKRAAEGSYRLGNGVFAFENMLKTPAGKLPPVPDGIADTTISLLYTGGTTGTPKGVPIPNYLFLENAIAARRTYESIVPLGTGIQLQAAPLFHILGQGSGVGAALCIGGDTLIMVPRVNLDAHFDHIQRYRVTTMFGVPSLYRMILEHDRLDQYDLSSLKFCMIGGDVVPLDLMERWEKRFKLPIYQGYGITEAMTVSLCSPDDKCPPTSVGKPVSMNEIRIVDPETLQAVPVGTSGELLVRSEHMVRAYWNKPEETREAFVQLDGKLWYKSKDLMRQDEQGWLYFTDRSTDMIKHKGYRVAASEIEKCLQENPAVVAACAIGVPDPRVGERIKAFCVLRDDIKGVTGYDLQKWCRERLAEYKIPQYIEFRDMLPKSKVGKVLRRELRAEERKKMEQ
jgi:long-chain acyl-CoA synthetase